jgi:hypothetical protein
MKIGEEGDVSLPRDNEVVVLAPFYESEFGLPLHPSIWGCSSTMGWRFRISIPTPSCTWRAFITLCEAFMGIDPHWKL